MDFKRLFGRVWPHLVVIALFAAIIAVFFSPMLKGYSLRQGDAVTFSGSSAEISNFRKNHPGEEPLWTNGMFAGMPAYTISVIYSGELLGKVENVLHLGLPYPASILLMALICYYILMVSLGFRPALAALGAIAFAFFTFSFVSIEAGHNSKVRAMAMAPLLLAGVALMYRDKRLLGFALAALGMGLQIGAGHYQVTYYLALFCVFLGIGQLVVAVQEKGIPKYFIQTALLVAAVAVGVAANAGRLWQLQEYAPYSMRGKSELTKPADPGKATEGGLDRDYVFNWSNAVPETFTLLIPGFYGGSSSEPVDKDSEVAQTLMQQFGYGKNDLPAMPYYWGGQPFTSGPVYAGAVIILLGALGIGILRGRAKWWLVAAMVFSVMLTWGKHFEAFNYAMYDYFPVYKQFRAVTMAIVILQWALPWLAVSALAKFAGDNADGEGLEDLALVDESKTEKPSIKKKDSLAEKAGVAEKKPFTQTEKALMIATGVVGGLCLIFALAPGLAGDFVSENDNQLPADFKKAIYDALVSDREAKVRGDAFRSLLFVLGTAGLLWAMWRKMIPKMYALPAIAILALFDLWAVNGRYLNKDSYQKNYYEEVLAPSPADQRMLARPYHSYRVLNLQNPFNESRTSLFHQSIGGYSPAKLRRYQDIIEGPLTENIQALPQLLQSTSPDSAFARVPVLNMLNTQFVKFGDEAEKVIENPSACGNAWFVPAVKLVDGPDAEYAALSKGFDPKAFALMDQRLFKPARMLYETAGGAAAITSYKANEIQYDVTGPSGGGLLVLSEMYYPAGWTATLDGTPVDIKRADYTLRAVEVPQGKHKLVFKFEPTSYKMGNLISMIASLAVFGVLAFVGFRAVREEM